MLLQKIISFIMVIISFITGLFQFNTKTVQLLDLSFGSHPLQKCDLYLPKKPADGFDTHSIVVYIHGGAWSEGDKAEMRESCKSVAESGYAAAATLNYRMIENENSKIVFDDMLDDIDAALVKIKTSAAEKGYTIDRAAIIGFSAGAHLAMLYSYSRGKTAPLDIRFVCSMVGPADFTDPNFYVSGSEADADFKYTLVSILIGLDYPTEKLSADNLDLYSERLLAASPINYITADCPPSLLEYGSTDTLVPITNAERLVQKCADVGARFDYVNFPNSGHGLDSELDRGEGSPAEKANELIWQYYETYLLPQALSNEVKQ